MREFKRILDIAGLIVEQETWAVAWAMAFPKDTSRDILIINRNRKKEKGGRIWKVRKYC